MEVVNNNYMPGDRRLIDNIVYELKSQGIFDNFRKECIADVDTKPAYQNLRQRVEGSVSGFLKTQRWRPDMNKNQVREMLRRNISESGFLETGVERIVDQVVNPKINAVFLPQVENVVYKYLGIEKPNHHRERMHPHPHVFNNSGINMSFNLPNNDLLPTDLEAVSPESETLERKLDQIPELESHQIEDIKIDEDESPPFEPIEENNMSVVVQEEVSIDSNLSGFSGLASHESNHSLDASDKIMQMDVCNQDSQISKQSSDDRLSIMTSDDNDTKMDISEDSDQSKVSKTTDMNSKNFDFTHESQSVTYLQSENLDSCTGKSETNKKVEEKKSERHRSSNKQRSWHRSRSDKDREDEKKVEKDKKEHREKERERHNSKDSKDRDREKDKHRKDKSKADKVKEDKTKKEGEVKVEKDKKPEKYRDKSKSSSSSRHHKSNDKSSSKRETDKNGTESKSTNSSSSKDSKDKKTSSSKPRDDSKNRHEHKSNSKHDSKPKLESSEASKRDSKSSKKDDKPKDTKHHSSKTKIDKHKKDSTRTGKKDSSKDDHYSFKPKKYDRRSTDRDSSDGHSGTHSSTSSLEASSSQSQKPSQETSAPVSGSTSGESGTSDQVEANTLSVNPPITVLNNYISNKEIVIAPPPPRLKLMKPKFASNIFEARRLMKIRKQLDKIERKKQLELLNTNNAAALEIKEIGVDQNDVENHVVSYQIMQIQENTEKVESGKFRPNILKKRPKIIGSKPNCANVNSKGQKTPERPSIPTVEDIISPPLQTVTKESWDEMEAKLNQLNILQVDYNSYIDTSAVAHSDEEQENGAVKSNGGEKVNNQNSSIPNLGSSEIAAIKASHGGLDDVASESSTTTMKSNLGVPVVVEIEAKRNHSDADTIKTNPHLFDTVATSFTPAGVAVVDSATTKMGFVPAATTNAKLPKTGTIKMLQAAVTKTTSEKSLTIDTCPEHLATTRNKTSMGTLDAVSPETTSEPPESSANCGKSNEVANAPHTERSEDNTLKTNPESPNFAAVVPENTSLELSHVPTTKPSAGCSYLPTNTNSQTTTVVVTTERNSVQDDCLYFEAEPHLDTTRYLEIVTEIISQLESEINMASNIQSYLETHLTGPSLIQDSSSSNMPKIAYVDMLANNELVISPTKAVKRKMNVGSDYDVCNNNNTSNHLMEVNHVSENLNRVSPKVKPKAARIKRMKVREDPGSIENFTLPEPIVIDKELFSPDRAKPKNPVIGKKVKKGNNTLTNKVVVNNLRGKRYSSDDLYKPRLQFTRSCRRSARP